jgi:hypothetical protein
MCPGKLAAHSFSAPLKCTAQALTREAVIPEADS